jgi:hypothetical protein
VNKEEMISSSPGRVDVNRSTHRGRVGHCSFPLCFLTRVRFQGWGRWVGHTCVKMYANVAVELTRYVYTV